MDEKHSEPGFRRQKWDALGHAKRAGKNEGKSEGKKERKDKDKNRMELRRKQRTNAKRKLHAEQSIRVDEKSNAHTNERKLYTSSPLLALGQHRLDFAPGHKHAKKQSRANSSSFAKKTIRTTVLTLPVLRVVASNLAGYQQPPSRIASA